MLSVTCLLFRSSSNLAQFVPSHLPLRLLSNSPCCRNAKSLFHSLPPSRISIQEIACPNDYNALQYAIAFEQDEILNLLLTHIAGQQVVTSILFFFICFEPLKPIHALATTSFFHFFSCCAKTDFENFVLSSLPILSQFSKTHLTLP